jgi:hypothetical protein
VFRATATPERLSTFSDGVFAVLITVLVLELRPPELPTFKALLLLWPTWLGAQCAPSTRCRAEVRRLPIIVAPCLSVSGRGLRQVLAHSGLRAWSASDTVRSRSGPCGNTV